MSTTATAFVPGSSSSPGCGSVFSLQNPVEVLLDEYRQATLFGFSPMDTEVKEQLLELRGRGWSIAVVTNGESGVQEATADRIGLTPLLDACVVSETVGIRKPDPRIFALAAERCGRSASGAWMVGDAEVDVVGAASAGMRSAWLARGRQWQRDDVTPTVVASSLCEALAIVSCAGGPA